RRWPGIIEDAAQKKGYRLAIIGGGAAGVELVFAAQHAFASRGVDATVVLVSSAHGLLPGHAEGVKRRVSRFLQQRGITNHQAQAIADEQGLQLATGEHIAADCIIGATGARAPAWLAQTDLARDERGYVLVDAHHRSLSHAHVFAAGDVCTRNDIVMARSGVHAVFAGPVLAHNLLASLSGQALQTYHPRRKSLYLLATGSKHAIASWGAFSAQGDWVWRWKNWIDRRFMRKHGVRGVSKE
ncbi:MAG: FAD-dependent oxidoreductase, partial [Sideroxydans sp.]